jgi:putative ABC transport system permease protein
MFKNYIVTTINNLLKHKLFSLINIVGLAIGLASCLTIALYVHNETSYDKHWSKAERLFRIVTSRTSDEGGFTNARNPVRLMPALRQYFDEEIEAAVRMQPYTREVQFGDGLVQTRIMEVDSAEVTAIFDFEVLAGNLETTLQQPNAIALSAELAQQFFGRIDAIDEILSLRISENEVRDLRVGAVYRLPAGNSILREGLLQLPAMIAMDLASKPDSWVALNTFNYVLLAPGVNGADLNARIPAFVDQYVDLADFSATAAGALPSGMIAFTFQQLAGSYLNSAFDSYGERGNKVVVLAFSAIALLVLAIGCINFIILSTAKAVQRAREVAIRKTMGASRSELMLQYLGESLFIVTPAMLLALMLVELLLPLFEGIIGKTLDTSFSTPAAVMVMLALTVSVALAGGFYPALVLSHYRPSATLTANRSTESTASVRLRNVLVTFQFSVMIALMAGTFVIYAQVEYAVNRSPGFNTGNLLFVDGVFRRDANEQNLLVQRIAGLPQVSAASLSGYRPLESTGNSSMSSVFSVGGVESPSLATTSVGLGFFRTYQIPLIAGRDFSADRDQPSPIFARDFRDGISQSSVIVNEAAVHSLGFSSAEDAIGQQISTTTGFNSATHRFTIVGVAADTQFDSPRSESRPQVYLLSREQGYLIDAIAVRFEGDPAPMLARIEDLWQSVVGDIPLRANFMEQVLALEFARERSEARLLLSFALLAITIACLGLFGSASFNVERRTKEIGIRKVMGAEVREIVRLLLWQFSRPVLLANLIAWPIAFWSMANWLERFAYRIDTLILVPLCVAAGLVALCIACVTVGGTAAKAASTRPILALRYE